MNPTPLLFSMSTGTEEVIWITTSPSRTQRSFILIFDWNTFLPFFLFLVPSLLVIACATMLFLINSSIAWRRNLVVFDLCPRIIIHTSPLPRISLPYWRLTLICTMWHHCIKSPLVSWCCSRYVEIYGLDFPYLGNVIIARDIVNLVDPS